MLITFKSKAAADVSMYAEHAKMLLWLIGKPFQPEAAPRGILTTAELPAALEKLHAASDAAHRDEKGKPHDGEAWETISVNLAQRAFPLIDMLQRASDEGRDVVWGV